MATGLAQKYCHFSRPPAPQKISQHLSLGLPDSVAKKFRFLGRPFTFLVVRFFGGAGGGGNDNIFGQAL